MMTTKNGLHPILPVTATVRLVTPAEAEHWLRTCRFELQRNLRPWWYKMLAHWMDEGKFRTGSDIDFARYRETAYLVNGYHTLTALTLHGQPYLLTVKETQVDTAAAIAQLYSTFDRQLLRSMDDCIKVFDLPMTLGLTATQIHTLSSALTSLVLGFAPLSTTQAPDMYLKDPQLRTAYITDWRDEAQWYFADIAGGPSTLSEPLQRQAVVSVALVTYRYAGMDASDFWRAVAHDDRLSLGDPAKALIHFLLGTRAKDYVPSVYARYVASAWNAFMQGRSLRHLIKPRMPLKPIIIAGTPHHGKLHLRYITAHGDVLHEPQSSTGEEAPPLLHRPVVVQPHVRAAWQACLDAGEQPTERKIRAQVGGSNRTLVPQLQQLRAETARRTLAHSPTASYEEP